jgi:hypothetical protein
MMMTMTPTMIHPPSPLIPLSPPATPPTPTRSEQRRRDLNREYREKKAALRAAQQHKGKGKGKATKNKEWKDAKREYRAKRKELKRERADVRREWKKERREAKQARREGKRAVKRTSGSADNNDDALLERVWLVVENLHAKR